ncbi:MAG: hypothetical protein ABSH20_17870 [Tepidisphaeraceae bacterium]
MTPQPQQHESDVDERHRKPNAALTVLLDTTVQLDRQKYRPQDDCVARCLNHFSFHATSSNARLEAKRAWIQRLAYLHQECAYAQNIPELISRVNRKLGANRHHHRMLTTCIDAIAANLSRTSGNITAAASLLRFRGHLADAILSFTTWWERSVHHEFDGTGCVRAHERPTLDLNRDTINAAIKRCNRSRIQCRIHDLFTEHKEQFHKIVDAVETERYGAHQSDELRRSVQEIKKADANAEHLCDDRICARLGDSIIAIDGIEMAHYASTNETEWRPLAEVLQKTYVNPSTPLPASSE